MEFDQRPVLVASQVVGGDSNVAVAISIGRASAETKAVGTSGAAAASAVGRRVDLDRAKVDRTGKHHGFWIEAGGTTVFVLPAPQATGEDAAPATGKSVAIEGVVLELPRSLRDRARAHDGNDAIYIYATNLT